MPFSRIYFKKLWWWRHDPRNLPLRTFCYDCLQDTQPDNVLLATWNESSNNNGPVQHVSEDDETGEALVGNTQLPPHSIPGFPAYFWFILSRNAYANIGFDSPLNGNEGMRKMLKELAAKFSENAVTGGADDMGDLRVLSYREDPFEPI